MDEKPFMYGDMGEKALLKWQLDYSMDCIIETFESIPDSHVCVRPRPNINAPGWIFGHIAVNEYVVVSGFAQGDCSDLPADWGRIFKGSSAPSEEELKAAIVSKDLLVSYWRSVRKKTEAYLDQLRDEDLKEIPKKSILPDGFPNRDNPIREFFLMALQNQNYHWGQLSIVCQLMQADLQRAASA